MSKRRNKSKVDIVGPWIPVPLNVLNSPAFTELSFSASKMLLEFVRQLGRDNNGHLTATTAVLRARGWKSQGTIMRALRELEDAELVFKTYQGHWPNKASLYAVTWLSLGGPSPKFDPGAFAAFRRGGYRGAGPGPQIVVHSPNLAASSSINRTDEGKPPPHPGPNTGATEAGFQCSPAPNIGHHLDKPSVGDVRGGKDSPRATECGLDERRSKAVAALAEATNRTARPKPRPVVEPRVLDEGNGVVRVSDEFAHSTTHWH